MAMSALTIALPKGRLLPHALAVLEAIGLDVRELRGATRKLIVADTKHDARFLLLKPFDVATFVEYGAADWGIVGQDVLLENESDLFEPLTLPFGFCRIALAARRERAQTDWRLETALRVASKYPRLTRKFFVERGWSVEIIPLHGSIEIAPALGLSDLVVDIVDTGRTLKENGLVELETLGQAQAALIVNRASHALRFREIQNVLDAVKRATRAP
ncbi:MAG: ATP phosphoribosyltransferase [Chloroflexi bacterium]|nr:MAG: ATP phosphoribosyltransferase [Chloroflexota bacterium]